MVIEMIGKVDAFPTGSGGIASITPSSSAWIAGPIVGSVSALAMIILGLLFWRRRRQRLRDADPDARGNMFHKPELHSDYVPPDLEMEGSGLPHELPAIDPGPYEMIVDELPVEAPGVEIPDPRDADGESTREETASMRGSEPR